MLIFDESDAANKKPEINHFFCERVYKENVRKKTGMRSFKPKT